jgi:hypothetical protein
MARNVPSPERTMRLGIDQQGENARLSILFIPSWENLAA